MNEVLNLKTNIFCNYYGKLIASDLLKSSINHKGSEIIIYKIYLPDFLNILNELFCFLDPKEIDRSNKFYKEIDKNRFIICRGLLKLILSIHTEIDIHKIKLDYHTNKKPYLSIHPSTFFNISHSGDFALISIANRSIGIDIEQITENYDLVNSLLHIYSDKETSFIQNATNKNHAFYSLWTRKEAFVKALGKGIDDDFSKFPSLNGAHVIDSSLTGSEKSWQIHGFEIDDNYIGAVAYEVKVPNPEKILVFTLPNKIKDLKALWLKKM
ncbi:4'-phosphopantetheinyl transferase family protein [Confluentibacter sediminis]|uniref:4'-phosphopantetheinyl transferase family protein n=1 Tax=Confluentibacter sediminis TaxID=2219045 RepID=UPI000DABCFAA|nr:4'-phosphopantetheinyl transferase superfamily protein [Confluentibacter sediminis]